MSSDDKVSMEVRQRQRKGTSTSSTASDPKAEDPKVTEASSEAKTDKSASTKSKKRKRFINIAPLNTPVKHRLETFGVIWHCCSIPFFACLFLFALSLGWMVWLAVILPYFIWWYGFDLHTPTNGKVVYRTREWMKNIIVWEWFANYFPINVHKACDLEATFSDVLVEANYASDDEEDLISEDSRTIIDYIFKRLGLSKRINSDSYSPAPPSDSSEKKRSSSVSYKRVSTGPRYIFGYHPHGVISMGVMGTFATNIIRNEPFEPPLKFLKPLFHDPSKGKRLLPGIGNVFPLTLSTQFTLPFYRDYLLSLGLTSASAKNIKSLINNGDNSVCVVVGGAKESLLNTMVTKKSKVGYGYHGDMHESDEDIEDQDIEQNEDQDNDQNEDQDDEQNQEKQPFESTTTEDSEAASKPQPRKQIQLVLKKRKGFVKLAIELGNVSLVPTFGFGEVDIYHLTIPKPGSWGYTFQQWMKANFNFTVPFFSARGIFIYDFGFLPYRNPINICMGRPVHIPQNALAVYKSKHPEFDENALSTTTSSAGNEAPKSKALLRADSFTNLFKITEKPKRSSIKTKIPQELLDHYHKLYVDELRYVYEQNKDKYGYGDVELVITD